MSLKAYILLLVLVVLSVSEVRASEFVKIYTPLPIYQSPSLSSAITWWTALAGDKLKLNEDHGKWIMIENKVGKVGWIYADQLKAELNKQGNNKRHSDIKYSDINKYATQMTKAQFSEYTKKLIGTYVSWSGRIRDVKKNILGSTYEVLIDMADNHYAVSFDVPKRIALGLRKNDKYFYEGEIKRISVYSGQVAIVLQDGGFY